MREGPRGGPGGEGDGLAGADERRGGVGDGLLLGLLADLLDGEPGLGGGAEVDSCRAAVDLRDQAAVGEGFEVAADGHVRDAELLDQFGHADRPGPVHAFGDPALSLLRQHRRLPFPQDPTQLNIRIGGAAIPGGRRLGPDVRIGP
nr:hypothetical protein GCM10025732_02950 [Glycomyces mayteni]